MKTPLALLLGLLALAPSASAAPATSLRGWTAYKAFVTTPGALLPTNVAYTDGVVYCRMNGNAVFTQFALGRKFDCVVIGSAPKEPAKVGGRFAGGQASYTVPPNSLVPGSGILAMNLVEIPRVARTLVLVSAIPAGSEPYTSYVEGGYHRGQAVTRNPSSPAATQRRAAARSWYCDPNTGTKQQHATAPAGWTKLANQAAPCVKAAVESRPAVVAAPLPLQAAEMLWLTKVQQDDFESKFKAVPVGPAHETGTKAVAAEYRALVSAQIRPEAKAAYDAAAAALEGAPAKIDAALLPVKMWGGEVTAVVGPAGENVEIQLSAADYTLLEKIPEALSAYNTARGGSDGNGGQAGAPTFDKSLFDPIQLHLAADAARKALPANRPATTTPAGQPSGTTTPALPLLTDEQKKLLTPIELANYEAILKSANGNAADRSLQDLLKTLTARTAARATSPAPAGGLTAETFDAAPDWQKDQLCGPKALGASVAAGTTTGAADVNNTANARAGLDATAAAQTTATAQTSSAGSARPPWADAKCKDYPFFKEPVVTTGPVDANLGVGQNVGGGKGTGDDKEISAKEKSKWITQDLVVSGAKGAMVGLLIGSLFGPLGLFLGPIVGAAIFYGVTKLTS